MLRQISITLGGKKEPVTAHRRRDHLFLSKIYKLTRVILVHIKFSTVSLTEKNPYIILPRTYRYEERHYTSKFFCYTPLRRNVGEPRTCCTDMKHFLQIFFFMLEHCLCLSISGSRHRLYRQLSRSLYCTENYVASRNLKLPPKNELHNNNVQCGACKMKRTTNGFPKSTNIYLKWRQTTKSLFSIYVLL
jgi:hypothetical protein